MSAASRGLSNAGVAFFGSLCAGTFGLGVWQTRRYAEKIELLAARERDLQRPPQQGLSNPIAPHQRVLLNGTFQHNKELVVGPRGPPTQHIGAGVSPQGYFVLTPLSLVDGPPILINRGWVPRKMVDGERGREARSVWLRPTGPISVVAVPLKPECRSNLLVHRHRSTLTNTQLHDLWFPSMICHHGNYIGLTDQP